MSKKYIPAEIEAKWQRKWREEVELPNLQPQPSKYYTLVELPYTSGDLHIGHWFTWAAADAHTRYKHMRGHATFFPHGFDAFGLPAENAAIKRGVHPKDWTYSNIEAMTKQFRTMGTVMDLDHVTVTCDPQYYRWNQWIFLKMLEKGIAYRGKAISNWCPKDKTVLADEHVEGGRCWRCGTEVEKKEVAQWFLKITKYADALLWSEKPSVDWPKSVQVGQNNWIGRSEGTILRFTVGVQPLIEVEPLKVFTTRPETTDGATFVVLSPEHPVVAKIMELGIKNKAMPAGRQELRIKEVKDYVKQTQAKSEQERKENKEKTGVFTGLHVQNPVTGEEIPVWVADYVIMSYGTGAIMGVPSADERDREFAATFDLPIGKTAFTAKPNGLKKVQYHIRDWSISRQRYWGTPVPIIYCHNCVVSSQSTVHSSKKKNSEQGTTIIDGKEYAMHPVPYEDLPVELPYEVDFTPRGKPPLATNEKWLSARCPNCGGAAKRDAETLDTFFDSSWYFYRYLSPDYDKGPFDKEKAASLMPVDVYFGGSEHTLGHTLYARFFTKFFKDLGLIDFDEFALRRVQHGVVLGPDGYRMSKSRGNVINPDALVAEYGADSVRLYLAFMMAYEDTGPWSPGALGGVYRFLKRVWGLADKVESSQSAVHSSQQGKDRELRTVNSEHSTADLTIMHKTIKKVGEDLEALKGNTAVAALMEWLNHLSKKPRITNYELRIFLLLLAPFAPHITEELWQVLNGKLKMENGELQLSTFNSQLSIHSQSWPEVEEKYLVSAVVKIPVQVDGKVRAVLEIAAADLNEEAIIKIAKTHEKVKKYLEGRKFKVIYVPRRLLNFVTS